MSFTREEILEEFEYAATLGREWFDSGAYRIFTRGIPKTPEEKARSAAYMRLWWRKLRATDPDRWAYYQAKARERRRKWRASLTTEQRERERKKAQVWRANARKRNPERLRAQDRERGRRWKERNPERARALVRERTRRYRARLSAEKKADIDARARARVRAWYRKNREKVLAAKRARTAEASRRK